MQGPTAARMRRGRASCAVMASTAACTIPPSAPFQPAWAAPITRASGSTISTGAQSAERAPSISPGVRLATASASGRSVQGPSATTAMAEWTW